MAPRISQKTGRFSESVIREMSRLAERHGAINLAQGFPDFPAPGEIKQAACRAIQDDINQYAVTWGARRLREAVSRRWRDRWGIAVDPETEVTVCCGSTEAMIASCLAVLDPGDEVVIFEPFYENYGPDVILCGAVPRLVRLRPPLWTFEQAELAAAFNSRTRAVIVNSPHNPTGKVFSRAELETVAAQCRKWNTLAITDEIYEYIIYDNREHLPICLLPGMRERTITVSGISKTFSVTGWRVGYVVAPEPLSGAVRKVHDFLTVGAAAPLQEAAATALDLPPSYYGRLASEYQRKRDFLHGRLQAIGFGSAPPEGAYYVMADIGRFDSDDIHFVKRLIEDLGVAAVPGSSFFQDGADGRRFVRFCYCKQDATLEAACRRLERLRPALPAGESAGQADGMSGGEGAWGGSG